MSSNASSSSITVAAPSSAFSPLNNAKDGSTAGSATNHVSINSDAPNCCEDDAAASGDSNLQQSEAKKELKSGGGTRSRTDSLVAYTPANIGEAPGATFYINKKGGIDYHQLLKALHKISLRDSVCTLRVCEALLSLLACLIDFGLLTNKSRKESNEEKEKKKKQQQEQQRKNSGYAAGKKEGTDHQGSTTKEEDERKKEEDLLEDGNLTVHNTFMDVIVR